MIPLLRLDRVCKSFPTPTGELTILRDVSFELAAGEAIVLLGPSGSGKTTLLNIIGALEPPTSGVIELRSQDPWKLAEDDVARFRSQSVGFVFQDHHLLPHLTLLENVLLPTLAGRVDFQQRARELLDQVGLADRMEHFPAELSGGERQRGALARALINSPDLILADEPTGNLDPETADSVGSLLLSLPTDADVGLITVTHSTQLGARFSRQAAVSAGRLVERAVDAAS